jgi:adenosylcobinamide kinase/adenosylcobinamide-phosphate guanylyltransferase
MVDISHWQVLKSELILGGQKSGKTARAEALAAAWLAQSPAHRAVYIATAQAWDEEMSERIARHGRERALRVPGLRTVEEPFQLAQAVARHGGAHTLIVVDCLTLWLTGCLLPAGVFPGSTPSLEGGFGQVIPDMLHACAGPIVLVSNEIGLGVIPLGREVRNFVDELGRLNQAVAQLCERVTLMAAGLPLVLKEPA